MDTLFDRFRQDLNEMVRSSAQNHVSKEMAYGPGDEGQKLYDDFIFAVGDAADPMWENLRDSPTSNLPLMKLPGEWMPQAKRVISYFAPFTDYVVEGNKTGCADIGAGWLYARVEGQKFLSGVNRWIEEWFAAEGIRAFSPYASNQFDYVFMAGSNPKVQEAGVEYTSNWSERHVAYVCGLGTFALSKALITPKGVCGRFGSVIVDCEDIPVTPRDYSGVYEWCLMCGKCAQNCPAGAIDAIKGKSLDACCKYFDTLRDKYYPRYGCGKCYVDVPCERGIPLGGSATPGFPEAER